MVLVAGLAAAGGVAEGTSGAAAGVALALIVGGALTFVAALRGSAPDPAGRSTGGGLSGAGR